MARRRAPDPPAPTFDHDPWSSDRMKEAIKASAGGAFRVDGDAAQFERLDDYVNRLTGMGDWTQDKTLGGSRYGLDFSLRYISSVDAENRWRGSDLGANIVEKLPDEMTREGWEITVQPKQDVEGPSARAGKSGAEPFRDPEAEAELGIGEEEEEGATEDPPEGEKPPEGEPDDSDPKGNDTVGAEPKPLEGGEEDPQLKRRDAFGAPGTPPGTPPPPGMPMESEPPLGPLPDIDDEGAEIAEAMDGKLEELGTTQSFLEAMQFERAYGGGAILIGADDGLELTKPLDEKNIKSISWLTALQGGREGEIVAWSYYRDPKAPKYGKPEIYMVRNIGMPLLAGAIPGVNFAPGTKPVDPIFWVHESRLLVFPGAQVSRRAMVQMRGWGDSVFSRVDEVLAQYSQTWAGVANLLTGLVQDVLAIDGSSEKMAGGDKQSRGKPLTARARTIQQTKSIARMLVIDRKSEEFTRQAAAVSGVSEILQQFCLRLAAAADMPVALLFGQAPAGLNATGASDIRFFYDRVASKQRRRLIPLLKRLIKLIFLSKDGPTGGKEPESWDVKPRSLYQMTELEKAELRNKDANTDHMRIQDGVLSPEEVTASAYGGSAYSSERQIDFAGRARMAQEEEAKKAARMAAAEKAAAANGDVPPGPPGISLPKPKPSGPPGIDPPKPGAPAGPAGAPAPKPGEPVPPGTAPPPGEQRPGSAEQEPPPGEQPAPNLNKGGEGAPAPEEKPPEPKKPAPEEE